MTKRDALSTLWERYYPQAITLVTFILLWQYSHISLYSPLALSTAATFGAIVFGFNSTVLSILTGLKSPVMNTLRANGRKHIESLRLFLGWGMLSAAILTGFCIFSLIIGPNWYETKLVCDLLLSSIVFCGTCLFRLASIMLLIFSDPNNTPT